VLFPLQKFIENQPALGRITKALFPKEMFKYLFFILHGGFVIN
jgi:hypothetical protein